MIKLHSKKQLLSMALINCAILSVSSTPAIGDILEDSSSWLLSQDRPAYSSSVNGGDIPTRATDGNIATQWGAAWESSNQWLDVDLGAEAELDSFVINWQNPMTYATNYQIQVSNDELNWTTIYTQENGTGGERIPDSNGNPYCQEKIQASGKGRYVRLYAPTCVSGFGIAVYEFQIYGKGGATPKPQATENLALNKPVTASSTAQPWWAQAGEKAAEKAVDGNSISNWLSEGNNNEWFQVDLGQVYKIGQVNISWEVEFGRVYEIQTSLDGINWDTVYRQLNGLGEPEKIKMYKDARYVKINGIAMGRGSGYSIRELEVLPYVEGDSQTNPIVENIPTPDVVQAGKGSYSINDVTMAQPRTPKYVTNNISTPIPSNDWWTSIIYTRLSDGLAALPYMFTYKDTGLGMYYATDLFTSPNNGGMDTKSNNMDLFINTSNIINTPEARVDNYGDWSVDVIFSDDETPKMRSTLVKGSPYVYNTFADPDSVEISAQSINGFFDDNNNPILLNDGDTITADHIGLEVSNTNTAPVTKEQIHSYGIFAPEGTVFTRLGSKIKIKLGSNENYLSIGSLTNRSDLNYMYQHAYAFVKDTTVTYNYDQNSSNVTTTFNDSIDLKRKDFSPNTLIALMPHQWKYTSNPLTDMKYESARGTMKVLEGNEFSTTLKFQGLTPSFGEPTESSSYNRDEMIKYLNTFKESITRDYWVADPYWQGKKTHPLAMGILIAEQLGEYETRDEFISILRKILANWFTYSGEEDDYPYYMYYSPSWGTLNGQGGDHGMGINLSDHHFLWSYFTFPAAVLASYDSTFIDEYGGMVEHLLRDSVNPSKTDDLYPFMRNFDPYESHSWAGGYGDNQSGNNQESASEATFAWAGMYLWGLVTGNDTYRDAGIWGFTSEVNAIEQYWFNYDKDNWSDDYTSGCVGMVWGSAYTNGTYFSGNPSCIYGIHMLPVSPALTYLGYKPEIAKRIYENYEKDQEIYQKKVASEGNSDPEGWFHILWPYQALSDPNAVTSKWDPNLVPEDERFNSYWYIQNMSAKGHRAVDVWSNNWSSYQIFKNDDGKYSAVIWNPTDKVQLVQFCNADGVIGSAEVPAKTTATADPFINNGLLNVDTPPAFTDPTITHNVPGKIEAEEYYTNFSCQQEECSEGGKSMAYIDAGDSIVYDVDVEKEDTYTVEFRINNNSNKNGEIQLKSSLTGAQVLSTVEIPSSDGKWTTIKGTVNLKSGKQKLTLKFTSGNFTINWLKLYTGESLPDIDDSTDTKLTGEILSENKSVSSSSEIGANAASNVTDNNINTRWESDSSDPQWIMIDLESNYSINGVKLNWETASGKDYKIQVSDDAETWNDASLRTNGNGGLEEIVFASPVNGRYVRLLGTARTTNYGYSLWEFEVYGNTAPDIPSNPDNPKDETDLALNKNVAASSYQYGLDTSNVVDGDSSTRWSSNWDDNQWIYVDLNSDQTISKVILDWENAYGKVYKIQTSTDAENWSDCYTEDNGTPGICEIKFDPVNARYVRVLGIERGTGYGYSLWSFEVYK